MNRLLTGLPLAMALIASSALAETIEISREQACASASSMPSVQLQCNGVAVSADRILACGRTTRIGATFLTCLSSAKSGGLTAEKIDICGERNAMVIGVSFSKCLEWSQSELLTIEAMKACDGTGFDFGECLAKKIIAAKPGGTPAVRPESGGTVGQVNGKP